MTRAHPKALLIVSLAFSASACGESISPQGSVPSAEAAIELARVALIPVVQTEYVRIEGPLEAEEDGDMWIVRGRVCPSLPRTSCPGRPIEVDIAKSDGRILRVFGAEQ
jgi:hypothetical protein